MTYRVSRAFSKYDTMTDVGYEEFENDQNREVNEIKAVMAKKSNIKDVCALLDMKSSKYLRFCLSNIVSFDRHRRCEQGLCRDARGGGAEGL